MPKKESKLRDKVEFILRKYGCDAHHVYFTRYAGSFVRGGYFNTTDEVYIKRKDEPANTYYNGKRIPNGWPVSENRYASDREMIEDIVSMCKGLSNYSNKLSDYIQQCEANWTKAIQIKESEKV